MFCSKYFFLCYCLTVSALISSDIGFTASHSHFQQSIEEKKIRETEDKIVADLSVDESYRHMTFLVEEVGDQLGLELLGLEAPALRTADLRDPSLVEGDEDRLVRPAGHRPRPEEQAALDDREFSGRRRPRRAGPPRARYRRGRT